MKAIYRRRPPAHRDMAPHKGSQREPLFFGETATTAFFQPVVQRKCAACEGEEKVHKKEGATVATQTNTAGNYIGAINGKGQAMDKQTRSFYENRMGADFSHVKVHTGTEAAASAKDINAQAYTYGNHVVFNEGKYQPETSDGKHLLAHELMHVVQQGGAARQLQRQVGPPAPVVPVAPAPHFRDCVRSVTGRDDADIILNAALNQARDFVNTAIDLLANAPVPGSVYETALALHFGHPISAGARAGLRRIYRRILNNLVSSNIICNTARNCDPGDQAFWLDSDDLLHICPLFWRIDPVCRSIALIHEAAHDSGIDDVDDPTTPGDDHTPDRGSARYPAPAVRPRHRVSRSLRANSPDAFAFFAAHVHNGADTRGDCFN
jgi:Domain of unknown function (DUF4157)